MHFTQTFLKNLLNQNCQKIITENRLEIIYPELIDQEILKKITFPEDLIKGKIIKYSFWNSYLHKTFLSLCRLFEKEKLPVIFFKGIRTFPLLFKERPVRLIGDIDLMIKKADETKLSALLLKEGFTILKKGQFGEATLYQNSRQKELLLDVHTGLRIGSKNYYNSLFSNKNGAYKNFRYVKQLSLTDEFIQMVYHVALHHLFEADLFNYYEIAFFLSKFSNKLDLNYLNSQISEDKTAGVFLFCLKVIDYFFEIDLKKFLTLFEQLKKYSPSKLNLFLKVNSEFNFIFRNQSDRFRKISVKNFSYNLKSLSVLLLFEKFNTGFDYLFRRLIIYNLRINKNNKA